MSRVFGSCRVLMAAAKGGAKEASAKAVAKRAAKAAKPKGAFHRPLPLSPAMSEFLGVPEIARVDAVKKIWEHIKANQLQNPSNKKEICCDEKLKTILDGKDKVGMFDIVKLIAPHFVKPQQT
ncbi:upstream activation factor subunit UAF30-like [Curcuma longa]|uniref:upstream activation factor subunit UAF30-like n=1 Tax=Curcuma longa TaxID=136217 RepID=UPI003D9EE539